MNMSNGRWGILLMGLAGVIRDFNNHEPLYIHITTIAVFTVIFFLHPYAGLFAKTPWYKLVGSLILIIALMALVLIGIFL